MLRTKADHPEAPATVHGTVDYMTGQHHAIEFLSSAPASIRAEMKELLSDLKLDGEAGVIIDTIKSSILTIPDLLDVGGGVADSAVSPVGSAVASTAPSSSSPSPSSPSPVATPTAREENAAGLRGSLKGVYKLQNRGKTGQGAHRSCAVMREAEEGEASGGAGSCCSCACALCICTFSGWWPCGWCKCAFTAVFFKQKKPDLAG